VIEYLVMVPIAYMVGSIPFGLLAGKLVAKVDIRDYGSGKIGMTNVLRTAGVTAAAVVLLLDMGKAVSVVVAARLLFDTTGVEAAAALAVIIGHNWPVFIGFRGGRGTASGWGGLLILSPIAGLIATVVGVSLVGVTRYMSLGSITAAALGSAVLVVLAMIGQEPLVYSWYGIIGGTLIVVRHRDNIQRLLNGTERKIGQKDDLASNH
jgi:glycerol-3-phosphate acyltransferase PlsY